MGRGAGARNPTGPERGRSRYGRYLLSTLACNLRKTDHGKKRDHAANLAPLSQRLGSRRRSNAARLTDRATAGRFHHLILGMIPKSGNRFSEKIMPKQS